MTEPAQRQIVSDEHLMSSQLTYSALCDIGSNIKVVKAGSKDPWMIGDM
jgi:hypothetical protein